MDPYPLDKLSMNVLWWCFFFPKQTKPPNYKGLWLSDSAGMISFATRYHFLSHGQEGKSREHFCQACCRRAGASLLCSGSDTTQVLFLMHQEHPKPFRLRCVSNPPVISPFANFLLFFFFNPSPSLKCEPVLETFGSGLIKQFPLPKPVDQLIDDVIKLSPLVHKQRSGFMIGLPVIGSVGDAHSLTRFPEVSYRSR